MAARKLRAKPPEDVQPSKPKFLVYGPPGVGKTLVSLDFPKVYYIDTEGGATRPHYRKKLRDSGGVYLGKDEGSQDFKTVIEEIIALATVPHPWLTLVIDSFSLLYMWAAAQAEESVGSDYGKDKKEANKPTRQLLMWLDRLDMNVVLIAHEKVKWVRVNGQLAADGFTFDGWDKMEHILDLALHIPATKGTTSVATVTKTRIEGMPKGSKFNWSFEEFAKRVGQDVILRPSQAFDVASDEQVQEVTHLVQVLKMDAGWEDQVFSKAGVMGWAEMPKDKVAACIGMLKGKLKPEASQ